jgi:hypothetical protein
MRLKDWRAVAQERGEFHLYRDRTIALLRKYLRMSVELGHLPSLFGREFFRSNVSTYSTNSFEDVAIFVHDMESALSAVTAMDQEIIARTVFQEYTYDEASRLLSLPRRSFVRRMAEAIDHLSEVLLDRQLLDRAHEPVSAAVIKAGVRQPPIPPKMMPVSVKFLMSLSNPKICQASKLSKSQVSK